MFCFAKNIHKLNKLFTINYSVLITFDLSLFKLVTFCLLTLYMLTNSSDHRDCVIISKRQTPAFHVPIGTWKAGASQRDKELNADAL